MKITFIHSPEDYYDQNYGTQFVPLWAYYLAAYVPSHWEIEIVDCRLEEVNRCGPADIFAFSGINQDLKAMTQTLEKLEKRFPKATYLLGGPITWSFEKEGKLEMLEAFDYLFILDGETSLPEFLDHYESGTLHQLDRIIRAPRHPLLKAKKIRFDLMDQKKHNYYGAVVEASRGCPFLCEFCDIRVLPGNNQTNAKEIGLFVEEIDECYKRGITKFQIACDNFIGDTQWAIACCDALLEWKNRTGANVSLFTWLTINIYKMPKLMVKMRQIGFSILFIGIESVNRNSLLETAKVQNMNVLEEAVTILYSYGFIIAPGLIFGFDSDTQNVFQETLDFLADTGTIGGDPSFLMALAGTPLYARMKKSGRLIEREKGAIERKKVTTNILYLQDREFLVQGFLKFVKDFSRPSYQYKRFKKNVELMVESPNFIPIKTGGYASPWPYFKSQIGNAKNLSMMCQRIFYLLRPNCIWIVFKAGTLATKNRRKTPGIFTNFFYWLYVWTNMVLKYKGFTPKDFDLNSVGSNFDRSQMAVAGIPSETERAESRKEGVKIDVQLRYTQQALQQLVENKIH